MINVIDRKIVGFKVSSIEDYDYEGVKDNMKEEYDFSRAKRGVFFSDEVDKEESKVDKQIRKVVYMNESLERPGALQGATYKIKTPLSEHAVYVTINDVVLNEGTEHESRQPYEVFINTKNADHFQWIVALTRIMSAVFRKGGDVVFMVDELRSVFDPRGGYFKKGGRFTASLVAEIGDVLEEHMRKIGLLPFEEALAERKHDSESETGPSVSFPDTAILCPKCQHKALVRLDGCETCLNCGDSKCG